MRVLMVLVALVTTPFVMSVAQGRHAPNTKAAPPAVLHSGTSQPHSLADAEDCKEHPAGNAYGWEHQHDECDSPPISGQIAGTVFFDLSYDGVRDADEPGIENWFIMLSGPVSATTYTDAAGSYAFTGLPDGTYTVCELQRFGWIQTAPQTPSSCTSGFGYTIVITAGQGATDLNFGNVG
jgi:hypothetical protein